MDLASAKKRVGRDQLLWIDVNDPRSETIEALSGAVGLEPPIDARLAEVPARADLTRFPDWIHLTVFAFEPDGEGAEPARRIDLIAASGMVVSVHRGPSSAVQRFEDRVEGESRRGLLDAAGFLAGIVDEVITGYFEAAESIEQEIEKLDEIALRGRRSDDVLASIVALRRRIGRLRRTLAPHRDPFSALARPEMELHEELGRPWPGLAARLDRALDAVENMRDRLLGTYDIHMGRTAQHSNDVMKALTVLSAVLLPSVVVAGVMGMNFKMEFFEQVNNFWIVIGSMATLAIGILVTARWRGWI